jgi:dTDP-4-amino-4,6-dideoxygalactose transaminase
VAESRVRFLDLAAQYAPIADAIQAAVAEVLASQQFVLGPAVERFEAAFARWLGVPHAVGVASGTDALYLALAALDIGPGDAVLTTPYSFVASASAIARTGARPYFADIDAESFNLDPAAVRAWLATCERDRSGLRAPGGERVRALLPVHLFGRPCAIEELAELAATHGLAVVEDAAQAAGARVDGTGASAGGVGRFGCFSFYPTKNLGGAGDGGCVVARDDADAARVRQLARHGTEGHAYRHVALGLASRLDALQAAVLHVKLPHVDAWNAARRAAAVRYDTLLGAAFGDDGPVRRPAVVPGHVFHQYVVRVPERDRVRAVLADGGIETQVYYPIPLHQQPLFTGRGWGPPALPAAERASREALALPIYPELDAAAAERVVAALARALRA